MVLYDIISPESDAVDMTSLLLDDCLNTGPTAASGASSENLRRADPGSGGKR